MSVPRQASDACRTATTRCRPYADPRYPRSLRGDLRHMAGRYRPPDALRRADNPRAGRSARRHDRPPARLTRQTRGTRHVRASHDLAIMNSYAVRFAAAGSGDQAGTAVARAAAARASRDGRDAHCFRFSRVCARTPRHTSKALLHKRSSGLRNRVARRGSARLPPCQRGGRSPQLDARSCDCRASAAGRRRGRGSRLLRWLLPDRGPGAGLA